MTDTPDMRPQDGRHHPHDHGAHHHHHHDHEHEAREPEPFDPEALVSARRLSFSRGGRSILQGIDLDIHPGEIVTLIGPNGAGKTTLVRVLLGILTPSHGGLRRRDGLVTGYVPQRFDLDRAIPMTVNRFLTLSGVDADEDALEATLQDVGAKSLGERQFSELSGGELQRVLIARALMRKPQLLVLDEPVRGVDYTGEAELYALVSRLRSERRLGIVLVSHDLHVVMAQSDRVLCINRHVCCSGVPETVSQHPEYARLFGPQAARSLGVYTHVHDHNHDLSGDPIGSRKDKS